MHAYRDAIVGTVGSFALYPGKKGRLFAVHGAAQPWEGIGALALRPTANGTPDSEQIRNLQSLIKRLLGIEART